MSTCLSGVWTWFFECWSSFAAGPTTSPNPVTALVPLETPVVAEVPAGTEGAVPVGELLLIEISPVFVRELLVTTSPARLGELCPSFLSHLFDHPDLALDSRWSARSRLGRAFRAGVSAGRVVAGLFDKQARSLALDIDNRVYIVLRCDRFPRGFWTRHYRIYCAEVFRGGQFAPGTVSHGFPSVVEIEAFLRGAFEQWPVELTELRR